MDPIFHLGAHKTASTHFNFSLRDAQSALQAAGLGLIFPQQVWNQLAKLSYELRDGGDLAELQKRARNKVRRLTHKTKHVLISDENILGGVKRDLLLSQPSRLYPWAGKRFTRYAQLLCNKPPVILLAIRELSGFLPSAYVESVLGAEYISFSEYIAGIDVAALRWSDLVARLQEETDATVHIWRMESYPDGARKALRAVIGDREELVTFDRPAARVGVSGAAMSALFDRVPFEEGAEASQKLAELKKEFPRSKEHGAYQPFDARLREKLSQAYREDWAVLGQMKNVILYDGS